MDGKCINIGQNGRLKSIWSGKRIVSLKNSLNLFEVE